MNYFKHLKVWQKGFDLAVQSFKLAESLPKEQKFALANQITRASVSIAANIAEGCSRSSAKDYHRFLELSLGSSYELETHLLIAEAVGCGDPGIRTQMLHDTDEEQKMLIAFMNKVK